jgi:DNA primase
VQTTEDLLQKRDFNFANVVGDIFPDGRRNANSYVVVCPFHGDTDPSLSIDLSSGLWNCFGCNRGGNAFHLLSKFYRPGVAMYVANLLEFEESYTLSICSDTELPSYNGSNAYFHSRNIGNEAIAKWGLGVNIERKAAIIPYPEASGFIMRSLYGGRNKYLNSFGLQASTHLFGERFVISPLGGIIVVESALDAIYLDQEGIERQVVALCGNKIHEDQVKRIEDMGFNNDPEVHLPLDSDAGGDAMLVDFMQKYPTGKIVVHRLPQGYKDVQEMAPGNLQTFIKEERL